SGGGFTRSLLEWELTQASARRKGRQRCGARIPRIRARPIRRRARTEQYTHLVRDAYDLVRICRSKPRWAGPDRAWIDKNERVGESHLLARPRIV
ncbi:MAG: hypothetical protein VST64_01200, partial [Nitrospirota bacterium]|nr:hypothetical protein [Nitrospirota bacterium]